MPGATALRAVARSVHLGYTGAVFLSHARRIAFISLEFWSFETATSAGRRIPIGLPAAAIGARPAIGVPAVFPVAPICPSKTRNRRFQPAYHRRYAQSLSRKHAVARLR